MKRKRGIEDNNVASSPVRRGSTRIGFLFNHEHIHQIAHSAPIAFELSLLNAECQVILMASSDEQIKMLDTIGASYPGHRCTVQRLALPRVARWIEAVLGGWLPIRKIGILRYNTEIFRTFEALVVPEKTTLLLRTRFGCRDLKMIHTRHGAGDRAVGFDEQSQQFDLVLVAGEKVLERLLAQGQSRPGQFAVVGYPKFDAVGAFEPGRRQRKLFDNDRPTVLYNPHCSPHLSSWYQDGRNVLEYFYHSKKYNLIFAPHVMLFRKRLQISIDKLSVNWARSVPERYRNCDHILIDLGSAACTDMTYTFAADLYLGDVSSQICEFLVTPRPCLFLNPHRFKWQGSSSFESWTLGDVLDGPTRSDVLGPALEKAFAGHSTYRQRQATYFSRTFDLSEIPSGRRAANAIYRFLLQAIPK